MELEKNKKYVFVMLLSLAFIFIFIAYFIYKRYYPRYAPNAPQQACTLEAMLCPDGTAVGRTGPNCEFAPCPDGNTTTLTPTFQNPEGKFCGGIAGLACPDGYKCVLDGNYPDAGGTCAKIN